VPCWLYPKKYNLQEEIRYFLPCMFYPKIARDYIYIYTPTRDLGGGGSLFYKFWPTTIHNPTPSDATIRKWNRNYGRIEKKSIWIRWVLPVYTVHKNKISIDLYTEWINLSVGASFVLFLRKHTKRMQEKAKTPEDGLNLDWIRIESINTFFIGGAEHIKRRKKSEFLTVI